MLFFFFAVDYKLHRSGDLTGCHALTAESASITYMYAPLQAQRPPQHDLQKSGVAVYTPGKMSAHKSVASESRDPEISVQTVTRKPPTTATNAKMPVIISNLGAAAALPATPNFVMCV